MPLDLNRCKRRARRSIGVVAAAALVLGVTATSASATPGRHHPGPPSGRGGGPVVATDKGPVRGATVDGTDEFLGIPYAAPPVGALRWVAPQPAARWQGVRDATHYAPHCAQSASPFGLASTSEDCLYLNVFTPAKQTSRHPDRHGRHGLPVMVWIHGGALVTGESDDYDPSMLVDNGTIVVTINYRLGALGFLAHPALAGPGGSSGNYGLMDQQAALRWVQRNIGRFGGNPDDVTIFGESAGGLSVLSQLASPAAHGLFDRAIVESGAYDLEPLPLAAAEQSGESFATEVGCPQQTAACLRDVPVSTILANQTASGYYPDIDGTVLTQSLTDAFTSGQFNRVPVINGSNHDEWRLFVALDDILAGNPVTAANYEQQIAATLGVSAPVAAAIAARYPLSDYASPALALGAVGTDAIFACPALTVDNLVSQYVPTYAYEFNDEQAPELFLPPIPGFPYGAAHASEIQYLFDLRTVAFPAALSPQQQQLASTMQRYWTNFAKRGFPTSFGTPWWPRFDSTTPQVQSLAPPEPTTETDFAAEHQCAFWSLAG